LAAVPEVLVLGVPRIPHRGVCFSPADGPGRAVSAIAGGPDGIIYASFRSIPARAPASTRGTQAKRLYGYYSTYFREYESERR
jgi:hypothetical protein